MMSSNSRWPSTATTLGAGTTAGAGEAAAAGEAPGLGVGVGVCARETMRPGMAMTDITKPASENRVCFFMDLHKGCSQYRVYKGHAYNQYMMKDRDDDTNAAADDASDDEEASRREDANDESSDETDADDPKRFERSDNLRRRSEWFQKRTGGR